MTPPPRRKGARRIAEIPADVLEALHDGREETITLVEWLAIDVRRLARAAVPPLRLPRRVADRILASADELAAAPVTVRTRGMGVAIHAALDGHPRREAALRALAAHRADTVRSWAAYARAAEPGRDLVERLEAMRPFAADGHMAVRECAWEAMRAHLVAELPRAIRLLGAWVRDADPNVRRCAVEATRPCGVWTPHVPSLKADPSPGLPLLEPVRSDPSDYVRRSVGNWLNDASKSRPDWVRAVCARWSRESPTRETAWIVNHATRTLRKRAAARRPAPGSRISTGASPPSSAAGPRSRAPRRRPSSES